MAYNKCKFCKTDTNNNGKARVMESNHADICMCIKCSEEARKVVLKHFNTP